MGSNVSVAVDTWAGGVTRYISERDKSGSPTIVATPGPENPPFQFRCGCSRPCSEIVAIDSLVKVWEIGPCHSESPEGWKAWPSAQGCSSGDLDWISLSPHSCYVVLTLQQSCTCCGAVPLALRAESSSAALEKLSVQLVTNITPESLASAAYVGLAADSLRFDDHCCHRAAPTSRLAYEVHVLHGVSAPLRAQGLVSSAAAHLHHSLNSNGSVSSAIDLAGVVLGRSSDRRELENRWVLLNRSSTCDEEALRLKGWPSFPQQAPALVRYFLGGNSQILGPHRSLLEQASLAATEALSSNGAAAGLEMRRQLFSKRDDRIMATASIPFPLVISPRTISAVIADASPIVAALAISPRGVRVPTLPNHTPNTGLASCRPATPALLIDRPCRTGPSSSRPAIVPGLSMAATLFESHQRAPDVISSPPKRLRRDRDVVLECEGLPAEDGTFDTACRAMSRRSDSPTLPRHSDSPASRPSDGGSPTHRVCDTQLEAVVTDRKRVPGLLLREMPQSLAPPLNPFPETCQAGPPPHGLRQQPDSSSAAGSCGVMGNSRRAIQVTTSPSPPPLSRLYRPTVHSSPGLKSAIYSSCISVGPSSACSRDSRTEGTLSDVGPTHVPSNQQPVSLPPRALSSDAIIDSYCSSCVNSPTSSPGRESDDEAFGGEGASKEALFALHRPVCSEVIPNAGLFISGAAVSQDLPSLRGHGITDIVNIAGDTCQNYFPSMFRYVTFVLQDNRHSSEDIQSILHNALEYISTALSDNTNRVLVHCREGVSRSATVVAAYLMWKGRINFADALSILRRARPLCNPNTGFTFVLLRFQKGLANRRLMKETNVDTGCNELAPPTPSSSRLGIVDDGDPGSPIIANRGFRRVYAASPRSDDSRPNPSAVERKLLQLRAHHENAAFLVAVGIAQYEPVQRLWMPAPPVKGLDPRFFYIARDNDLIYFWRGSRAIHRSLAHSFLIHEYLRHLQMFEGSRDDKSWRVMFVNEGEEPESFWACLYPEGGGRRVAQQSEFDSAFHVLRESDIYNFAEYCRRQRVGEHGFFNALPQMQSHISTNLVTPPVPVSGVTESPNVVWNGGASDADASSGLLDSLDTGQSTNRSEKSTLRRRFTLTDHLQFGDLDQENGFLQERVANRAGPAEAYVILSPRKRRLLASAIPHNPAAGTSELGIHPESGSPPPLGPTRSMPAFAISSLPQISSQRTSSLGSLLPSHSAGNVVVSGPQMVNSREEPGPSNVVHNSAHKGATPYLPIHMSSFTKSAGGIVDDPGTFHSSRSQLSTSRTDSMSQRPRRSEVPLPLQDAGPSLVKTDMRSVRVREGKVELEVDMPYLYEWPYFSNPLDAFDDEDLRPSGFFIIVQFGPRPLLEMLGSCQGVSDGLAVLSPPTMGSLPADTCHSTRTNGPEPLASRSGRPFIPWLPPVPSAGGRGQSESGSVIISVRSPRRQPILFKELEGSQDPQLQAEGHAVATKLRLVALGNDEGGGRKPSFRRSIEISPDMIAGNHAIQTASSSQRYASSSQRDQGEPHSAREPFSGSLSFREVEIETVVTPTILWVWRGKHWRQQQLRGDPSDAELLEEFKQMHGILPTDEDVIVNWEDDGHESDVFQKLLWLS